MAHFAKLDENNVVINVIVIDNSVLLDENNIESENKGILFCENQFGGSNWKQTSYNKNFRMNFAGIGMKYDEVLDAFIHQQPYPSWIFDASNGTWNPPKERISIWWEWSEEYQDWIPPQDWVAPENFDWKGWIDPRL
jgi:hypothetical protein